MCLERRGERIRDEKNNHRGESLLLTASKWSFIFWFLFHPNSDHEGPEADAIFLFLLDVTLSDTEQMLKF